MFKSLNYKAIKKTIKLIKTVASSQEERKKDVVHKTTET